MASKTLDSKEEFFTEVERNDVLNNIIIGIEGIAKNHSEVRYNSAIVAKICSNVEETIANSPKEIKYVKKYAKQSGYYWALNELRIAESKEGDKDKETKLIEARIEEARMETRMEIAKQELMVVVYDLLENATLTKVQKKQLQYLAISFLESYEAADEAFSESSKAAKRQWRKRARDLILEQNITENLKSFLVPDTEKKKVKFASRW